MTTLTARYRPGRRRASRPLFYVGRRRQRPAPVDLPGYVFGMAGGALFASAGILASAMGLLPW